MISSQWAVRPSSAGASCRAPGSMTGSVLLWWTSFMLECPLCSRYPREKSGGVTVIRAEWSQAAVPLWEPVVEERQLCDFTKSVDGSGWSWKHNNMIVVKLWIIYVETVHSTGSKRGYVDVILQKPISLPVAFSSEVRVKPKFYSCLADWSVCDCSWKLTFH